MIVKAGSQQREMVISLLREEKLPVSDLPASLDNFLLAFDGMKVIGVIGIERYDHFGLLRSLVVSKDHRNQNIASSLVEALEQYARLDGIDSIYLLSETAPRFFEKKGYGVVERGNVPALVQASSEFSYVCPQSAIVMYKKL